MSDDLAYALALIRAAAQGRDHLTVALDGRCASGKTTLAASLASELSCTLIHMDDFFLRPEQRTPERLARPGENIDHERFLTEVLIPLSKREAFSYAPFDCHTRTLGTPVAVSPTPVVIVEGSYACHPKLRAYYDLRLFLSVPPEEQLRRIAVRNGADAVAAFRDRWIPLEEAYFSACEVEKACITLSNSIAR